jgi:competence protein ComEC
MPVRYLLEPGHVVGHPVYLEMLETAERRGVAWRAASSGRTIEMDGLALHLLWPDSQVVDAVADANEISVVVLLRFGGFAALLTGDASAEVERLLVDRHGDALRAPVLKAGHHGSRTSTSDEWLDAVRPELVVVSAGRGNRYGHPAPEVVKRLVDRGIEIARTDHEGSVSLRVVPVDGRRWSRVEP